MNNFGKEQTNPAENDLPPKLSNPAKRALTQAGIVRLEQLTTHTAREISNLYGIGPNALTQLQAALAAKGWSFADEA